ncbi:glycosyltransferase family 4 protein [Thermovenabulum gondwanense]|uniref:Putative glycosyltransferase EpsD n=1 Tax=Thermovenabulum gondwanense TaxID=520767 RepID=A0A162MQ86_9FIRM|nr:glycosyltransferase family 4 protein [Thermovenabulum gondwanense]KYO66927.1 putative glycosyltransferase EpsD [Thermovenabulum gondwanense]
MNKILFIATVENHIVSFHIPFIKYFQKKGYEVHVATKLGQRHEELKGAGVILHNVNFERSPYSLSNIKALTQLKTIMRKNKFSLVHVHTPVGAFLGRLAAKITNTKPVLYTAHGFHFYKGAPFKNWMIYYNMEKIAAYWTDGIITMNDEDYEIAQKLHIKNKENVFKVHGVGVELDKYYKDETVRFETRKKLGLNKDDICILTVAELIKNKNHKQLIDAMKIINKNNVFVFFAGNGEYEKVLKKYASENNLDYKIKFLGYRKDIPELLSASDIFCLMSYREGLPRCIMEAMAAGKPVVATNVRGNRDLVKNGINGFLVPVNDVNSTAEAINKLISDENLRKKMGVEGRKIIQDYSIENVLKEMDKIYTKFID